MMVVGRYRAVLFDWRGTLVHYPELAWWVERAFRAVDRPIERAAIDAVVTRLEAAWALPEIEEASRTEDSSAELNRSASMLWCERAGLDDRLAESLYRLDFDPENHPMYPDVPGVLASLRALGVKTALVSDIHFDLRAYFAAHDIEALIDAYILSFELGYQKPDSRMFEVALKKLDVEPREALMVGDRASHDGAAASVGIDTLILPMPKEFGPRGLDVVTRLVE
jgi:HAD superfamily hydrolase (TIGR01509 family)